MTKERFRDEVVMAMEPMLDKAQLMMLNDVLVKKLEGIEFANKNELATYDDSNEYLIKTYLTIQSRKLSEKTLKVYMSTLKDFLTVVNKPLTQVTSIDIEYYLGVKSSDNTEVSLNNYRRNLSAIFTWFRKKKYIEHNPVDEVDSFKEVHKPIDHLEVEELEQLKNGCRTARERALLEFLRCTAVRVGELVNVKISDIDFENRKIMIYGHKTKEWRECWLDKVAMGYVKAYINERGLGPDSDEYLFVHIYSNEKLSANSINHILKQIKEQAGLQRPVYVHLMRKTVATSIVRRGGSVEDAGLILGHKEQTVTGKHYAYKGSDYKKKVFDNCVAMV